MVAGDDVDRTSSFYDLHCNVIMIRNSNKIYCYKKLLYSGGYPSGKVFWHRFGLKTGIHFAHFGLESGWVFKGVYEHFVSIPNE